MGTLGRNRLDPHMIAIHKKLMLLQKGIGIYREHAGITQGYALFFTCQTREKLPEIGNSRYGSCGCYQGKGSLG
jgi:hypothetical protein